MIVAIYVAEFYLVRDGETRIYHTVGRLDPLPDYRESMESGAIKHDRGASAPAWWVKVPPLSKYADRRPLGDEGRKLWGKVLGRPIPDGFRQAWQAVCPAWTPDRLLTIPGEAWPWTADDILAAVRRDDPRFRLVDAPAPGSEAAPAVAPLTSANAPADGPAIRDPLPGQLAFGWAS